MVQYEKLGFKLMLMYSNLSNRGGPEKKNDYQSYTCVGKSFPMKPPKFERITPKALRFKKAHVQPVLKATVHLHRIQVNRSIFSYQKKYYPLNKIF